MFGPRNHTPRIGSPATESVACLAVTAGLTGCSTPEAADAEAAATVRAGDGASASAGTESVTKRGRGPEQRRIKHRPWRRRGRRTGGPAREAADLHLTCARPAFDQRSTSA